MLPLFASVPLFIQVPAESKHALAYPKVVDT